MGLLDNSAWLPSRSGQVGDASVRAEGEGRRSERCPAIANVACDRYTPTITVGGPSIRVLLVEPEYYTRYPPLGLLKLASLHRSRGHEVHLQRGAGDAPFEPDLIEVTSLFTFSWKPVHTAIESLRSRYPSAEVRLGGIYATLMPEHAALAGADEVHTGLVPDAENLRPAWDLVPEWESSILFGTRGCIRKCAFCAVPKLEGKTWGEATGVRDLIDPKHRRVVLWDNNVLGVPNWREIARELREMDAIVDFNQGLDARLIDEGVARDLQGLRIRPIRMAYDIPTERKALERAIPALHAAGFSKTHMHVYTLYNFTDTPADFLRRVIDLLSWGVVSFPMRYEPLSSLTKNKFVSPHWTLAQLELVARARQVLGSGGAFPPSGPLLEKLRSASSFEEAFELHGGPRRSPREDRAGTIEERTPGLSDQRARFRELLNDPMRLAKDVECASCSERMCVGESAFAVQDYSGRYVGYVCPTCHPNRRWINGLWRSVLGEAFGPNGQLGADLPLDLISRTVH